MPNGDPNWAKNELPQLEAFFCKISDILEEFAATHNLMIEKYYHQGQDWTFRFRHPKGGLGGLTVKKSDEVDSVWIGGFWWIDDYDKCTRSSKHTDMKRSSIREKELRAFLVRMLHSILSWQKEDLWLLKSKYDDWHKSSTKEQFERRLEQYPTPN